MLLTTKAVLVVELAYHALGLLLTFWSTICCSMSTLILLYTQVTRLDTDAVETTLLMRTVV